MAAAPDDAKAKAIISKYFWSLDSLWLERIDGARR
jgi:hypothetical protein